MKKPTEITLRFSLNWLFILDSAPRANSKMG